MSKEIEHKYLVKNDSYKEMAQSHVRIIQGYLNRTPKSTVRLRKYGDVAFLTIKSKNIADSRDEFEYEIPVSDFEQMIKICDGRIIDKTRYIVNYEGYKWEVDEFHNDLAHLIIAEVELAYSHHNYPLPPFVGEEVTGNDKYYNSNL